MKDWKTWRYRTWYRHKIVQFLFLFLSVSTIRVSTPQFCIVLEAWGPSWLSVSIILRQEMKYCRNWRKMFTQFWPLWLTLTQLMTHSVTHSDSLWLTLTHSDSLWLTLTHSDSARLTMTHSDSWLWLNDRNWLSPAHCSNKNTAYRSIRYTVVPLTWHRFLRHHSV